MSRYASLFDINGRTAVITGGTRGIGEMIATGFVDLGVKTYVTSRKADACADIEEKLGCTATPFDLSKTGDVEAFAAWLAEREDKIDILINNAGASWGEPLDEYSEDGWDRVIDLNVKSIFFLTQKLLPQLRKAAAENGRARVINIGSVEGLSTPAWENYAYPVSKAAVHHMTRILSSRLARDQITVNAIAPGPFQSKMTTFVLGTEEGRTAAGKGMPLGRIGKPEDVIGLATFLSSPAADFITGTTIPLDGGYLAGARPWQA